MATSLADLFDPSTEAELEQQILTKFSEQGFPTSSWHPGSVPTTLVKTEAHALSELYDVVKQIAKGGFVSEASGDWLTLLAQDRFGLTRTPATNAVGLISLTVKQNVASPGSFGPGAISVAASGDPSLRYVTTAAVTLPNGGTGGNGTSVTVAIRAEQPGAALPGKQYNNRTDLTILNTAIPGVTVSSSGPTFGGADEQADASLAQACLDRWATLGTGATAAQYRLWAIYAINGDNRSGITEAFAEENPPGTGQISVYCTSGGSAVSDDGIAIAQAYIDDRTPLCTTAEVVSATVVTVVISGTVIATPDAAGGALTAIRQKLDAYVATQRVGGEPIGEPSADSRGISFDRIVGLLLSVPGVQNLAGMDIDAPDALDVTDSNDVVLDTNHIIAFDTTHLFVNQTV